MDSQVLREQRGYLASMGDPLDVPLEDSELLEETVLAAELIVAANLSPLDALPQADIDRLLGVWIPGLLPTDPRQRRAQGRGPLLR